MGSKLAGDWNSAFPRSGVLIAEQAAVARPHTRATIASPTAPVADVAVIDSDEALRFQLQALLQSVGLDALLFAGPESVLECGIAATVRCLLLDVRMRGASGLDFQAGLRRLNIHTPIIFMTAHGDIPMAVHAMKAGAIDFLCKPLRDQDVLDAISAAIDRDQTQRQRAQAWLSLQTRLGSLTPREKEVIGLVTAGMMNKQIAAKLNLSEVTVKMHRASAMRKMEVRSVAALTRIVAAADLPVFGERKFDAQLHAQFQIAGGIAPKRPRASRGAC